jgi:hypothetical protein
VDIIPGNMLNSKKNVFWEALVITMVIFLGGLFLGMLIETGNSNKISNLYLQSEIGLADGMSMSRLTEEFNFDCDAIKDNNILFADRIYEEARLLEDYEEAGKLTDDMPLLHKKYDLLRTLLWTSNQRSLYRCDNYNLLVYLYEYDSEDLDKKAVQNVWSKILSELKTSNHDILLLPIAVDQNLSSLNLLIDNYNIEAFPALVINNDEVLYEIESAEYLESLLG